MKYRWIYKTLITILLGVILTLTMVGCQKEVKDKTLTAEGIEHVSKVTLKVIHEQSGDEYKIRLLRSNAYTSNAALPAGTYRIVDVNEHSDCDYELVAEEEVFIVTGNSDAVIKFKTLYIGASLEWFVRNNALMVILLLIACIGYIIIKIKKKRANDTGVGHE